MIPGQKLVQTLLVPTELVAGRLLSQPVVVVVLRFSVAQLALVAFAVPEVLGGAAVGASVLIILVRVCFPRRFDVASFVLHVGRDVPVEKVDWLGEL